jgi:hypothetical protein
MPESGSQKRKNQDPDINNNGIDNVDKNLHHGFADI